MSDTRKDKASTSTKLRVRVRPGAQLAIGKGKLAGEGEWIEFDPHDLEIPSLAACVETQAQIDAEEAKRKAPVVEAPNLFDSLRTSARAHIEQQRKTITERAKVDATVATATAKE